MWKISGWQIGGIVRVQAGDTVPVTQATNSNSNLGFALQRPNRISNPNDFDTRSAGAWFNTAAFTIARQFTIGNSSRDPVRGPGLQEVDLMIGKTFRITERLGFEFRAEVFNMTNTPPLNDPNGSFSAPRHSVPLQVPAIPAISSSPPSCTFETGKSYTDPFSIRVFFCSFHVAPELLHRPLGGRGMKRQLITSAISGILCALPALCQSGVPIYRVTVVQRSVDAVNYQYRSGPTKIDFAGTVLMSKAKGEAVVDSVRGRTEIDAKFEHIQSPSRFGREYLTYVLWAITPEGRPRNIGEIVADSGDKSKIRVTTEMQAFGLIVTAEPYSAVRTPSDVVVLENKIRPDTIGKFEPIIAKYELMPRGQYTWQEPANLQTASSATPKVSMDRYEALLELYQAQNAIGIARAARADQYAPNTLAKADQLLAEAQRLDQTKGNSKLVVQSAREAAQTAEDARAIAERHEQDEKVARAQADASVAQQAQAQATAEATEARAEANAARVQADAERVARERAEADAAAARQLANQAQADAEASRARTVGRSVRLTQEAAELNTSRTRMHLLEQLNGVFVTRDTPRGLVIAVPDGDFSGGVLRGNATEQLARIGRALANDPGLHVSVEGYSDSPAGVAISQMRADAVQNVLFGAGFPSTMATSRGLGDSRLLTSNSTDAGRIENRRVEIVVTGAAIGSTPYWDHAYVLRPQ